MSLSSEHAFSLLKFSHTTDPVEKKKWDWKHETRDLHLTFGNYGGFPSRQRTFPILSVLQSNTILERVDISAKTRDAEELVVKARQIGKHLKQPDEIPTAVLYKRSSCAIAIRYPYSETKARRLQLKFESVQDFDRALSLLQDLGCYIRIHDGQTQSDTTKTLDWPISRSHSTEVKSSHFNHVDTAASLGHEVHSPRTAYSDYFQPTNIGAETFHTSSQLPRSSTRSNLGQLNDKHRPSTPLFPIHEDVPFHTDPVLANIGGFDAKTGRVDPLRRHATAISSQYNSNVRPESPMRADSASAMSGHGLAFSPSIASTARPSTTSKMTITQLEDNLKSMIPPRRELPFKRPGSRQSGLSRDESISRPSTSTDLPSLPKPSFINPPPFESPSPLSRQVTLKEAMLEHGNSKDDKQRMDIAMKHAATSPMPIIERPSTAASTHSQNVRTTKSSAANAGANVNVRPSTALSINSTNINVSDSAPTINDYTVAGSNADHDLRSALDRVGSTMATETPTVHRSLQKENLADYANMAYDERMAVLERMILDGIRDDNFITLCEDVHGCWQRIGLGR